METPLRILVVEDNPQSAASLAWLLEIWGHEVRVAGDGFAALDVVPEFFPDVVLLDIGLPGMDGFELAELLATNLSLQHTKLVALTACSDDYARRRARAAGISAHLTKPVDLEALQAILINFKYRKPRPRAFEPQWSPALSNAS